MERKEVKYEAALTQYLFQKASRAKIPLSGTFELSPVCNLNCRMCYVRKTPREVAAHDRPLMKLEQWLRIAREAKQAGMLYLLLTGGEPFLWPDFWELYEQLVAMGFLVSINSNGTLIDEEAIRRLRKNPPTRINITLYGAGDESYQALCRTDNVFTRVDRAIQGLRDAGIMVKLNCSLTPANACDLEALCRYAREKELILEVNTYMFPPLRRDPAMVGQNQRFTPREAAWYHFKRYQYQQGDEAYIRFLKNAEQGLIDPPGLDEQCLDPADGKITCRAGNASFWITWDGWMTPCGMMPEPKVDMETHSFADAWAELVRRSDTLAVSGVCGNCANQRMCHACAAMAMTETGSAAGVPTYLCRMVEEMKHLAKEELAALGQ